MSTNATCVAFALVLVGTIAIGVGIRTRLGRNRAWYLVPNYYVLLPKSVRYALPIGGLMLILVGISILMPTPTLARRMLAYGAFPLMAVFILIVVLQPKWLKPKWVQWLEENHGDVLEILIAEARQTPDWRDWSRRVSTQEGLEEWVAEVRRRHGFPDEVR